MTLQWLLSVITRDFSHKLHTLLPEKKVKTLLTLKLASGQFYFLWKFLAFRSTRTMQSNIFFAILDNIEILCVCKSNKYAIIGNEKTDQLSDSNFLCNFRNSNDFFHKSNSN